MHARKKQMVNKLNEITDQRRQKELQLEKLYSELDNITQLNLMEDIAHVEVRDLLANTKDSSKIERTKLFQKRVG